MTPKEASPMAHTKEYRRERTTEPGIFKKAGRYVVLFRDSDGKQRSKSCETFQEARDFKAEVRQSKRRPGGFRPQESSIGFSDFCREWIAGYQGRTSRGIREVTLREYRRALGVDQY